MDGLIDVKCSRVKYFDEKPGEKYRRTVTVKLSRDYLEACAGGNLASAEFDSDTDFADALKDAVEEATGETVDRLEYSFYF